MKLPSNQVEILNGVGDAMQIAKDLHAAYWLAGRDDGSALFLYRNTHESLASLARNMGYTLTPIAPPADQEAAE